MRHAFALALLLPLLSPAALLADDEREERARRIKEELSAIDQKEKEIAAAVEKEMAGRKEELVRIRAELATALESHTEDNPKVAELTTRAERLAESLATLEARRDNAVKDLAAARARLQEQFQDMRRAAARKGEDQRPDQGKKVTVVLAATPIRDALAHLAKEAGLDYVFLEGRLGEETVSGSFDDVPAVEVAATLLQSAGYEFDRSPSGVVVVRGRNPRQELSALEATQRSLDIQVQILQLEARRRELQQALEGK